MGEPVKPCMKSYHYEVDGQLVMVA